MSELRIGELLVKNGLVTREQLFEAIHKPNQPHETLGQVLRKMGVIKKEDLDNILDLHRKRPMLGEILLRDRAANFLHHCRTRLQEVSRKIDGDLKVTSWITAKV